MNHWQAKSYELVCSPEILEEYEDVLLRLVEKYKKDGPKFVQRVMSMITAESIIVRPKKPRSFSRDPDDDKFINCAMSGKALYIVSGDNDLLDIQQVENIEILTAREFLDKMNL